MPTSADRWHDGPQVLNAISMDRNDFGDCVNQSDYIGVNFVMHSKAMDKRGAYDTFAYLHRE